MASNFTVFRALPSISLSSSTSVSADLPVEVSPDPNRNRDSEISQSDVSSATEPHQSLLKRTHKHRLTKARAAALGVNFRGDVVSVFFLTFCNQRSSIMNSCASLHSLAERKLSFSCRKLATDGSNATNLSYSNTATISQMSKHGLSCGPFPSEIQCKCSEMVVIWIQIMLCLPVFSTQVCFCCWCKKRF